MRIVLVAAVAAVTLLGACATESGNSGGTAQSPKAQQQAQLDRAVDAIKARNYAEAETLLAGILANDPNEPYANLSMGALKAITDDRAGALQYYRAAIQHGESARMTTTTTANGKVETVDTTVAEVARTNVSRL